MQKLIAVFFVWILQSERTETKKKRSSNINGNSNDYRQVYIYILQANWIVCLNVTYGRKTKIVVFH